MQVSLMNSAGELKGKFELPDSLLQAEGSPRLLHEVTMGYQSNQRLGTSSTKTRGEVRGGGHKPWKQKGTGNARAGSIRSPLWRKGGIIFGPRPRSYRVDLDRQKRQIALQLALKAKAEAEQIIVLESWGKFSGKTQEFQKFFDASGLQGKILLVVDKKDPILMRAVRNLPKVSVADVRELNAYLTLLPRQVVLTQPAIAALSEKFSRN